MTDPGEWGISARYQDHRQEWREAPQSTVEALLGAMGAEEGVRPPATGDQSRVRVITAGAGAPLAGRWDLRTEDGSEQTVEHELPHDLPLGYHRLRREEDGHTVRLVVSPGACFLPRGLRSWGWAVQLPGARSEESWGIGDFGDLRRLGAWSTSLGAGMCLISPLHAPLPVGRQQPSPYFPSSRCFRNPLYIRIEDVPGAGDQVSGLSSLAAAGRALNSDPRVDRDEVWRLKLEALEILWESFQAGPDPRFDAFCRSEGGPLAGYATFCALAEENEGPWSTWPSGLQDPDGAEVLGFVDAHRHRIRFHQWLQWLVETQVAAAGAEIGLVQDLAIGSDPDGADAWLWQSCFARGVRVGAPADEFNTKGQDWGLPPFDPWRLRAAAYEPFVRMLRTAFRHAGGVRVDHVMGLFRLFWIPAGAGAQDGTYVRYPAEEMLGILALESQRAGAYVVGEDLGTVEDSVREELAARRVLSYRLLWFEDRPPREFPAQSLAAVTTHDLPTVAGLWSGEDMAEQERLGLAANVESTLAIHERVSNWTGIQDSAPVPEVVQAVYRLLAEAPSSLVAATLEDALGVQERPNIPGTTDERPNWSMVLPRTIEELESEPLIKAVVEALSAGRTSSPAPAPVEQGP